MFTILWVDRSVEQANLDAGNRFSKDLSEQFANMCASLEQLRYDHATFCGEQRMKLGKSACLLLVRTLNISKVKSQVQYSDSVYIYIE